MTEKGDTIKGNRIYFLDNLRTFMIFLVVIVHSGLVYESSGFSAFMWIVYDPATNNLAGNLRIILDIFIMSTIFFISGYLTPISLKSKKSWAFIKTKFKRLFLPWMIAVLTLMPLYKFLFLYSRDLPQQNWTTYFHWSNDVWSQNWLWFLPVLFLFDILYLSLSKVKIKLHISLKQAIGAVFIIGFIYSACMDIFNYQGWTKTIVLDFQNERLLIYFMMFLLGSLCFKQKTFESKPKNRRLYFIVLGTVWIPVIAYRFFNLNVLMKSGAVVISAWADTLLLWLSFHLSLFCLLYLLIHTFRVYLNKQGNLSKALNKNSYHVYIIHTIVMGLLAFAMLNITLPSLLKFLLLTVLTFGVSNLIIDFSRKVIQSLIVEKSK